MSQYYSSEEFAVASINAGALRDRRNLFNSLIGLLFPTILLGMFNWLNFEFIPRLNLLNLTVSAASIAFISYNVYCFIIETSLTQIHTGLSAADNQKLVLQVFKELGWAVHFSPLRHRRRLAVIRLIVNSKTVTVLPAESALYLNVMRKTAGKGEIPASFGSNKKYLQEVVTAVNKKLLLNSFR